MAEGYTTLPNVMRYYGQVENGQIVRNGTHIPCKCCLLKSLK